MKNILHFRKAILLSTLLLITSFCFGQVKEEWVRRYHGTASGVYEAKDLAVDAQGNVYVTGQGGSDYVTVKYDAAGKQLWVSTYNNVEEGFTDGATDIAVDAQGNVYVTGYSAAFDGIYDYATIKYDANGKQQWVKRYGENLGFPDEPTDIAVDAVGNVYVTGSSYGGDFTLDYATIKYDTNGNEIWIKRYSGADITSDEAYSLAVDAQGNVYVTGTSVDDTNSSDYITIKYNDKGDELWVKRYNGPKKGIDEGRSIAVDVQGNVYVTGESAGTSGSNEYATIKYDANGNELWVSRYVGPGWSSGARFVAVDAQGNVYVSGESFDKKINDAYPDYATVKYDPNGKELWVRRYNGPGNKYDLVRALVVDALGNVYITGQSMGIGITYDYATIKYDTNGKELWVERYNGPAYGSGANSLAVDMWGHVYVTGASVGSNGTSDFATIKYVAATTVAPVVSSFTLVDAGEDRDIRALKDGDTINLAALPTKQLNIRANASVSNTRSVVFHLSGKRVYSRTEKGKPYALFGDEEGDYYSATLQPGAYTLKATPYSDYRGGGIQGTALTIHFHVLYQEVSSFTLVNADTDEDIRELKDGDVIDLGALGGVKLNVRADTKPVKLGSVVFEGGFGAQSSGEHTENQPPYAVLGDVEGNYNGAIPAVGAYTLTATPYSGYRGSGQKGVGKTIHVKVVNSSLNSITRGGDLQLMMESAKEFKVIVAPNPMSTTAKVQYQLPVGGQVSVQLFDASGKAITTMVQGERKAGVYSTELDAAGLAKGVYYYRALLTTKQKTYTQTGRLMVVK